MKYYILDDVIGTVKTLENIIVSRKLGTVVGSETDPEAAIGQILAAAPDIVLIDLLMSKKDGISVVKEINRQKPNISFVMISKITNKEVISEAYNAGIEFFINKPINIIEVETILTKISEKLKMEGLLQNIKGIVSDADLNDINQTSEDPLKEVKLFLSYLSMLGEKGTKDILTVCEIFIKEDLEYCKENFEIACNRIGDTPKNVDQRIRRAIKKGLTNVAHLALEDYGNSIFQDYSGYVFDYKNVKEEMDHIRGTGTGGGSVNIGKFISGLLQYNELKKDDLF